MRRLIRIMFDLSDGFALLLALFAIFCAIANLIVVPAYAEMNNIENFQQGMFINTFLFLVAGVGFYLLSKRMPIGWIIVFAIYVIWLFRASYLVHPIFGFLVLAFFGAPLGLSFHETKKQNFYKAKA